MADVLDYKIIGDDLQLVEVELDPGEGVRAEAGTMTPTPSASHAGARRSWRSQER